MLTSMEYIYLRNRSLLFGAIDYFAMKHYFYSLRYTPIKFHNRKNLVCQSTLGLFRLVKMCSVLQKSTLPSAHLVCEILHKNRINPNNMIKIIPQDKCQHNLFTFQAIKYAIKLISIVTNIADL